MRDERPVTKSDLSSDVHRADEVSSTLVSVASLRPKPARGIRTRRTFAIVAVTVAATIGGVFFISSAMRQGNSHAVAAELGKHGPRVEGKRIVVPAAFVERTGLKSVEVRRKEVVPAIAVVGTVTFDPAYVARVGVRLEGVVRNIFRYEGDKVRVGEQLATLDSPELATARANVASLESESRVATRQLDRENLLAARQLTTTRDVEESQAAAERATALLSAATQRVTSLAGATTRSSSLGIHVLTAPLSGTVIERHISKGQLVDASHSAYLVANLDHVWVELTVFERSLPKVRVGDRVEIRGESAEHASPVFGEVAQVSSVVDPQTRGAAVRVRVANHERRFRPGQSVQAVIREDAEKTEQALSVPSHSVVHIDGQPSVFILQDSNVVAVKNVKLGVANGHEVEIVSGIEEGQRVVVQGATELRNELFR